MSAERRCECGTPLGYRRRRCDDCKKATAYGIKRRWQIANYVPAPPRAPRVCSVDDCGTKAHARGWCTKHWSRWRVTGDPLGLRPTGRPIKGEAPGYDAAHRRVSRANGPAKLHACAECGEQAAEWSYVGGDIDELTTDPTARSEHPGLRYSLKPEFYAARCVPCHRALDGSTQMPRARTESGRFK